MNLLSRNTIRGESNGPSQESFISRDHPIQSEQVQTLVIRIQALSYNCIQALDGSYSHDPVYLSRKKQLCTITKDIVIQKGNSRIDDFHYRVILAAEKRLEEALLENNVGECLKRFNTLSSLMQRLYATQHE